MGRPPRRAAERLRREQWEQERRQREHERERERQEREQRRRDHEQYLQDMERQQQEFDEWLSRLLERNRTAAPPMTRDELKKWHRTESMKCHPDRGGTDAQQILVNQRYEDELRRIERSEALQALAECFES
jgi:hypothetical protein